jgi:hypothetical protein
MAERQKMRHWADADIVSPPDFLTDDMRVSDLIEILEHLPFRRNHGAGRIECTISIDRGVRDYLVRAIKPPR